MFHPLKAARNYLNYRYPLPANRLQALLDEQNVETSEKVNYTRIGPTEKTKGLYNAIADVLRSDSIDFFRGNILDEWSPAFVLDGSELPRVISSLKSLFENDETVRFSASGKIVSLSDLETFTTLRELTIFSIEYIHDAKLGQLVAHSNIYLYLMTHFQNYSQQRVLEMPVGNPYLGRIRETTFTKLAARTPEFALVNEGNKAPSFPIDFVYTWVNDKDAVWSEERKKYSGSPHYTYRANHDERFTNRDELRYSLRSLEIYAPFFKNIYLVTNGQLPDWLNLGHSQLKIVHHKDIYHDTSCLPTFNSNSIESQIHHIEGLSEQFIYMNDDFFLGSFCTPQDFFVNNGMMKFFPSHQRVFEEDIDTTTEGYLIANLRAMELLESHSIPASRALMLHTPMPALRSLLFEMEARFKEEWETGARNRFRGLGDINPLAFLINHYAFWKKLAIPSQIPNGYFALGSPRVSEKFRDALLTRPYQTFCINDVGVPPERAAFVSKIMGEFLENYFPFKSSFEK